MKLKLLASAALAASLAFGAAADIGEKKIDFERMEGKEVASQSALESLFDGNTTDHTGNFLQESRIEQDGRRNDASVDQTLSDEGLAQIRQHGRRNSASVVQGDFSPTAAPFNNPTNIAVIDQAGGNNNADTYQDYLTGPEHTNIVEIHQISDRGNDAYDANYATAEQFGSDNTVLINQDGNDYYSGAKRNDAVAIQYGTGHLSTIDQSGADNIAVSWQEGEGNTSLIIQDGYGGAANEAYVGQYGNNNDAYVKQTGEGNYATVDQYSDENIANVDQYGWGNEAYVVQAYGDLNASLIVQSGTENYASSSQ